MREILRKIPLFAELNEEEIDAIASLSTVRTFPKKKIVVQEGETGDAMFIILKGSVKISYYTIEGREVVLSLLEPGTFFGEMALLDEEPRSATAMTMEASELAQIRRADFHRLMQQYPKLMQKVLSEIVARLRRTSSVLERISTMDVPHRLYDYVRDYCHRFGTANPDGSYDVKLPTHQLLADQLSTSRETISRAISTLKKEKIIAPLQGRGRVRVDMQALDTLLLALQ
ncbi:MAG TPA: Crp/Fnr family transcriptional regulator [Mariprofundaceae bacterium]|nr:Crp/Fnr family transcriptional regulator [Mariprofundaceae bacterium]